MPQSLEMATHVTRDIKRTTYRSSMWVGATSFASSSPPRHTAGRFGHTSTARMKQWECGARQRRINVTQRTWAAGLVPEGARGGPQKFLPRHKVVATSPRVWRAGFVSADAVAVTAGFCEDRFRVESVHLALFDDGLAGDHDGSHVRGLYRVDHVGVDVVGGGAQPACSGRFILPA